MSEALIAVALPVPLHRLFDYRAAETAPPEPGTRVRVSFGRRELIGIVVTMRPAAPDADPGDYKPLLEVLDERPLLCPAVLSLCAWIADYYHQPPGEVLFGALPTRLRRGAAADSAEHRPWRLSAAGRAALADGSVRAERQRQLLAALAPSARTRADLRALGADAATWKRLVARGWVEAHDEAPAAGEIERPPVTAVRWNAEQRAAIEALSAAEDGYSATLLEGITGSGKTEVYLACAARQLARGRQVLMLVPEIALTPQLLARVRERLGAAVDSYHSGLGDAHRLDVWRRARDGRLRVVVGTRSALFLPLPALGLIVVDEEHDPSFKQQDGVPFSARDAALVRARDAGVPALLGSATPSLESLHNVASGRYRHLRLRRRAGDAALPALALIDVRGLRLDHGLSAAMIAAIERHLRDDGQVLLFVNRRGWAASVLCHDCGWSAVCAHCDARPTLHAGRRELLCHHCGSTASLPAQCPLCASARLVPVGQGTERIESALRARFPQVRCERFDSDRLQSQAELERLLDDTRRGDVRLLVGTQLLAKGHDFRQLTLVGVVSADQALFSADFRALERMGQLITQVAGRAGRAAQRGEVLVQTHEPTHPMLDRLLREGYRGLADALLEERRTHGLPPYSALAMLRADALDAGLASRFLEEAAALLPRVPGVEVLGPVPAPMERRAGRLRAQLLLRSAQRARLQRALRGWPARLESRPLARRVRWTLDVDPVDLF